jgi:hypothetical protein
MAVTMLLMMASTVTPDRVASGFLSGRVFELGEILIGVLGLLAMFTLRHDLASLNAVEQALAMSSPTQPEHHVHHRVSSL